MRYARWRSMAGHSDRTLCLAGEHMCRQDVSEPVSTPVVFDTRCRQAYVAMLRGTVRALAHQGTPGEPLASIWTAAAGEPVISAPAFLAEQRSLVVGTVHGSVRSFSSAKGELSPYARRQSAREPTPLSQGIPQALTNYLMLYSIQRPACAR